MINYSFIYYDIQYGMNTRTCHTFTRYFSTYLNNKHFLLLMNESYDPYHITVILKSDETLVNYNNYGQTKIYLHKFSLNT